MPRIKNGNVPHNEGSVPNSRSEAYLPTDRCFKLCLGYLPLQLCNLVFEIFLLNRSLLQIQKCGHGSCDAGMNPAEVKIVQQLGDCILYGARGVDRGRSIAIGHRSMAVGLPIRASSEPCFDGREKAQSARQSALNDVRMPTTFLQTKRDVGFVLQNAALRH